MTPQEIQQKADELMKNMQPEERLAFLKILNGSIEEINEAFAKYTKDTAPLSE